MKVYKAYAKVNIFLKITGTRDNYHEIISRFMKVDSLFDELSFIPKEECGGKSESFCIVGDFSCETEEAILETLIRIESLKGPIFFEIRVKKGFRSDIGRPKTTPLENKTSFTSKLT